MAKDTLRGYRGSLDAYMQLHDSGGALGAPFSVGNLQDFTITPAAEEVEIISTGNSDFGQAADAMTDPKPTKVSFSANRHSVQTMAVNFMGSVAARSAAQATVTDEVVPVEAGGLFRVDAFDISAMTVKDAPAGTSYAVDTDFVVVDAALGLLRAVEGGGITTGTVAVSYTKAAETGYLINGGVDSSKFVKIFGRGVNRFDSSRCFIEIARGSIRPAQGFGLVGNEPAVAGYEVTITTPTDGSAPFKIIKE